MAYNLMFSVQETANPAQILLVDQSTGSDGNLTSRAIYLYQANSQLLVAAIDWPLADNTITLDVLQQDYALDIRVTAISSSPLAPPSSYTYAQIFAFTGFGELFYYQLTQSQTAQPGIIQDQNFYNNKSILRTELDSAKLAISVGEDIYGAQGCIIRYQYMIQQQNYFF